MNGFFVVSEINFLRLRILRILNTNYFINKKLFLKLVTEPRTEPNEFDRLAARFTTLSLVSDFTYDEAALALYGKKSGEVCGPSERELAKIRRTYSRTLTNRNKQFQRDSKQINLLY